MLRSRTSLRGAASALLVALLALGLADAPVASPAPEPMDFVERPDDELYIYGLRLDRFVLNDGMIVYYDGERTFVPLGAITETLEFPIEVDPDAGTASGWFLNDDRRFELDLRSGEVLADGQRFEIDADRVERHVDDIFVELSLLEAWFPILVEVKFNELAILVTGLEPLPVQSRIAQEERRKGIRKRQDDENYERLPTPEPMISWPFLDTSAEWSLSRNEETISQGRFTATAAGVVANMDSEATIDSRTDGSPPNLRFRAGQTDPMGGLFGPVEAREFALGDIATPSLPLIAENTVGRGAELSTFELGRLQQTNRVTLRGELPVGWEVELYRNGELIDFQTEDENGDARYEFRPVPTVTGLNEFRFVFYGPQGQSREEVERHYVTPSLVDAGTFGFRVAGNQQERDVIDLQPSADGEIDDGSFRAVGQAEFGLSDTFSLVGGLATLSLDGARTNYASAGLRSSLFGALFGLDTALDDTGRPAFGLSAQTRLFDVSVSADYSWYGDFRSEWSDNGSVEGDLRSRATLRTNGYSPEFGLGRYPFSSSASFEEGADGDWQVELGNRISAFFRPFNVSLASKMTLAAEELPETEQRFLVGTRVGDVRLRGEVNISTLPQFTFDSAVLNADWRVGEDLGLRFGIRHKHGDSPLTVGTVGLTYDFDAVAVGLNLDAASDGQLNGRLGLSFGLGRDPRDGDLEMRSQRFAQRAALSVRVFLDRDGDGSFSEGDELLPQVAFDGPLLPREVTTGDNGTALIVGLEPYRDIQMGVRLASLEDPFWVPAGPPIRTYARPGTATLVEFPILETGEVDGVVVTDLGGRMRAAGGLEVQLIDSAGKVVRKTTTAYDGFFIIDRVPYGSYDLRLEPEGLLDLGYGTVDPIAVSISAEEPFAVGHELVIEPQP